MRNQNLRLSLEIRFFETFKRHDDNGYSAKDDMKPTTQLRATQKLNPCKLCDVIDFQNTFKPNLPYYFGSE